jgi:hypothetical protein
VAAWVCTAAWHPLLVSAWSYAAFEPLVIWPAMAGAAAGANFRLFLSQTYSNRQHQGRQNQKTLHFDLNRKGKVQCAEK